MAYFHCSVCGGQHASGKHGKQCLSKRANAFPVLPKQANDFPFWLLKKKVADPHLAYLPTNGEMLPHYWTGKEWIALPKEGDMSVLHECKDCKKWHPRDNRKSPLWCLTQNRKPVVHPTVSKEDTPVVRKSLMEL